METKLLTEPVDLDYVEQGKGTPLVLLHGFPLNRDVWTTQRSTLSDRWRIVTPDLRGHGHSPAPAGAYSMDVMAQDVLQLLDRLDIDKAVIVGHSMGGYISLALWRLAPERVQGLALVASHHLADDPEAYERRYHTAVFVAKQGPRTVINRNLFAAGTPLDSPLYQITKDMTLNTPPDGIIGALQAMAERPDSTNTLRSITVPVAIIAGETDRMVDVERAQAMHELIADSELTVVAGAGHVPMMEQPDVVNAALCSLMRRVEQG